MYALEMTDRRWWMYVARCSDNTLYTGITTDTSRRINEHNRTKKGARYTRSRRPVKLIYEIELDSQSSALRSEIRFKKLSRSEKIQVIEGEVKWKI